MKLSINPEDRLGAFSEDPPKIKKKVKAPPPPPPPKPPRKKGKRFSWGWMLKWSCILLIWATFFGGCFVLWFSYDLPDITKLQQTERRPSISVLAQDGTKLATYGDLHGQMVDIKKLPPHVVQAFLAIEDRRFYSHFGVDLIGLFRAIWINYRAGHVVQGGSTITQQLAKNFLQAEKLYDINDRSLRRKIQEALLAVWLEHKFTKDQILTIYVNRVYLGSGTFGLAAAAQHYFGKRAKDLNLYEAAVIAGLLKAPSKYSPSHNPDLADQRATQVLENMAKEGFITEGAKDAALALASSTTESFRGSAVRYFTDWIVDILPSVVEVEDRDVIITTTLDPHLQTIAEEKMQEVLEEKGKAANAKQMALVSMGYDGGVLALVGGANYKQSQFNRATQALRQPGSTFKMILYLAALEAGMQPMDLINDMPIRIGSWQPGNYKYKPRGEVTLQDAMAHSANSVSVRLAQRIGLPRIVETARRLGLSSRLPNDLTIVLGTGESTLLELTSAFAVIARDGLNIKPFAILKVTDMEGNVLYAHQPEIPHQVVEPVIARNLANMLAAVMSYGTGAKSALPWPSAGKTGTTQNYRDAYLVGFAPGGVITGVWAGNDDETPLDPKPGSPAARLWHLYMAQIPPKATPQEAVVIEETEPSGGLLDGLIEGLFGG